MVSERPFQRQQGCINKHTDQIIVLFLLSLRLKELTCRGLRLKLYHRPTFHISDITKIHTCFHQHICLLSSYKITIKRLMDLQIQPFQQEAKHKESTMCLFLFVPDH